MTWDVRLIPSTFDFDALTPDGRRPAPRGDCAPVGELARLLADGWEPFAAPEPSLILLRIQRPD